ncbi:MAG: hypothetical protein HQK50_09220 [Oligoflexia bacterium]|nr:hypothetical protein [Oligoflexia bacterium]
MIQTNQMIGVPFISSNIHLKQCPELHIKDCDPFFSSSQPYVVKELHTNQRGDGQKSLRIGILGLLGPNATKLSLNTTTEIIFDGFNDDTGRENFKAIMHKAQETINFLKQKEKVDIIIILFHGGYPEDEQMAKALKGVNVIIAGHLHKSYPTPKKVNNTWIAQTRGEGEELGILPFVYRDGHLELQPSPTENKNKYQILINDSIASDEHYLNILASYSKDIESVFVNSEFHLHDAIFTLTSTLSHSIEPANPLGLFITSSILKALNQELQKESSLDPVDVYFAPMEAIRSSLAQVNNQPTNISFSEIFSLLSLGFSDGFAPGYPVTTFYLSKKDFFKLLDMLEVYRHLEPLFAVAFSDSLSFRIRSWGIPFVNRLANVTLNGKDYSHWPDLIKIGSSELFSSYIFKANLLTHGWFPLTPRDAKGNPISRPLYETKKKEFDLFASALKDQSTP